MIDSDFPNRLREERKRNGLNQAEFAALGGVKKLSQLQYEKGERLPSLEYIAELWHSEATIDVGYILTGKRSADQRRTELALRRVLDAMQDLLSLIPYGNEFEELLNLAYEEEGMENRGSETYNGVRRLLNKSPNVVLSAIDLVEVIEPIEFVLEARRLTLSPSDKSDLFFRVYQSFKAKGGRLDLKMVEDALCHIR